MVTARQVFPLDPDGAASDRAALVSEANGLTIADRTAWPRFGLKGPRSADWLRGAGLTLPEPNRLGLQSGLIVLRLGGNDIMVLSDDAVADDVSTLRGRWEAADAPKGYSSWREEGWAWLHLDGPALDDTLARCCAVDLRAAVHPVNRIAQTGFAHVDAVVLRRGRGVDVLFDIAATAAVLTTLRQGGAHA